MPEDLDYTVLAGSDSLKQFDLWWTPILLWGLKSESWG